MRFNIQNDFKKFQLQAIKLAIWLTIVILLFFTLFHFFYDKEKFYSLLVFYLIALAILWISLRKVTLKNVSFVIFIDYMLLFLLIFLIYDNRLNPLVVIWYPPLAMSLVILASWQVSMALLSFALLLILAHHDQLPTEGTLSLIMATFGSAIFGAIIKEKILEYATQNETLKNYFYSLATTDTLTKLFNRRYFFEECGNLLNLAKRKRKPIALLSLDLDHFKSINDTYGHQKGDEILAQFANTLKETLRGYDLIARIGGEEFVVCIYDEPHENIATIAEKIRQKVHEIKIDEQRHLSVSIGVTYFIPDKSTSIETFLQRADKALYIAKQNGRNQVAFDEEIDRLLKI